jgi:ABC-2 type transport system ATP-binding protein
MSFIVSAENITKRFHGKNVLDGFSLEIADGTVTGLAGVRGSGKTVALLCILGLLRVNGGTVSWQSDRKNTGAFIGAPAFHRELSIRGNLEAQSALLPKRKDGYGERIGYLMAQLQITPVYAGDRAARHLLTGQKQRLAIAMALLGEPELLVLDEPHLGLDDYEIAVYSALLRGEGYGKNKTALITTSSADALNGIANKMVYLREGRNASF